MKPKISVCVPNLNMRPFLASRFDSIANQTFKDIEIFIYDSYSDDGAWELLNELAAGDPRVTLAQGPRAGPYAAWNECIRRTKGEFVYIATSDDTMSYDFLEKMYEALQAHPECDIAHSPLRLIDAAGELMPGDRWPNATAFADGIEDAPTRSHVRLAPYDGLLHLSGRHVYLSIAQLLVRRSLFDKIGLFDDQWGAPSDFNWEMKAGLVANTIHVPQVWATWRIHGAQLTNASFAHSNAHNQKVDDMIQNAVAHCRHLVPEAALDQNMVREFEQLRQYYTTLSLCSSGLRRRKVQLLHLLHGPRSIRSEIVRRAAGQPKWIKRMPNKLQSRMKKKINRSAIRFID